MHYSGPQSRQRQFFLSIGLVLAAVQTSRSQIVFLTGTASRIRFGRAQCEAAPCLAACSSSFRTAMRPFQDSAGNYFGFSVGISNNLFDSASTSAVRQHIGLSRGELAL